MATAGQELVVDKLARLVAAIAVMEAPIARSAEQRAKDAEEALGAAVDVAALVLVDLHRIADAAERIARAQEELAALAGS